MHFLLHLLLHYKIQSSKFGRQKNLALGQVPKMSVVYCPSIDINVGMMFVEDSCYYILGNKL